MKKRYYLFLLTIALFTNLVACSNEADKKLEVKKSGYEIVLKDKQDIFNFPERNYYVYFYKNLCPYCEKVRPIIESLAANKEVPLYFVNAENCDKLDIFTGKVIRSNDYELSIVPTILVIKDHELDKILSGSDHINSYFH